MYGSLLLGWLITCSGPGLCVSLEFAERLPVEVSSLLSSSTIASAADRFTIIGARTSTSISAIAEGTGIASATVVGTIIF